MWSFDESVAAISNNMDFATMFDEDEVENLFRGADALFEDLASEPQPQNVPSHASVVSEEDDETSSCKSSSSSSSPITKKAATPTTPTGATTTPQNFINIVMIVDPRSGKVMCPEQVLSYDVGNGKIEQVVFGPTVLDALPQEMLNLTKIASQQAANDGTGTQHQELVTATVSISPPFTPTRELVNSESSPAPVPVTPSAIFAPMVSTTDSGLPPLRALSAYNFYFRDERDRILNGGEHEWTVEKQQQLLAAHWNQDRTKKRRHRKSHGKIDFTTLSRLISSRWKELSESKKEFYRQVASQDWERFQRELDASKKPSAALGATPEVTGSTSLASVAEQFRTVIG